MLKLTLGQMFVALEAARKIKNYEAAKDRLQGWTVPFMVDRLEGDTIEVTVPAESVRQELSARIAAAHQTLAALGLELVPGDDD